MKTTKKIAMLGVLTALYVALSLTLKIPLGIGNIQLDLGYIVLTVACVFFGPYGAIAGGLGALIESAVFAAYGISWGWIAMNVVIGLSCGMVLPKIKDRFWLSTMVIISGVFVGAVVVKTGIECSLYGIPLLVKLPKSLVAWAVDSIVMVIGLLICRKLEKVRGLADGI